METVFNPSHVLTHVYADVQQRFSASTDLAHSWDHVSRVYKLALHIAEREGADRFIVGMAALLHDLGQTVHEKNNEHHVDLSVRLASELLQSYQVASEQQQAILHAIIAHSFSRGVEPLTLEARVMRDADRLDALGAIGIMRWAITGTQRSTPQTKSYDQDDPFAEQHIPDDREYMLDHFSRKLLKLAATMTTETGRMLAQRLTAFMRTYLYEFKRELELW